VCYDRHRGPSLFHPPRTVAAGAGAAGATDLRGVSSITKTDGCLGFLTGHTCTRSCVHKYVCAYVHSVLLTHTNTHIHTHTHARAPLQAWLILAVPSLPAWMATRLLCWLVSCGCRCTTSGRSAQCTWTAEMRPRLIWMSRWVYVCMPVCISLFPVYMDSREEALLALYEQVHL